MNRDHMKRLMQKSYPFVIRRNGKAVDRTSSREQAVERAKEISRANADAPLSQFTINGEAL